MNNLFLLVIFTKIRPIDCVILLNLLISQTCTSISVLYCILYDSDLEHFCGFYTIQNKLLLLHGHQVAILQWMAQIVSPKWLLIMAILVNVVKLKKLPLYFQLCP